MGFFSIFSRGDTLADASYCDKKSQAHHDHLKDDDIDNEYFEAEDRGDDTIVLDEFHNKAVNYRWNDYGEPAEQGPKKRNGEL